jgi:hypothetical protein
VLTVYFAWSSSLVDIASVEFVWAGILARLQHRQTASLYTFTITVTLTR